MASYNLIERSDDKKFFIVVTPIGQQRTLFHDEIAQLVLDGHSVTCKNSVEIEIFLGTKANGNPHSGIEGLPVF